MANHSSALKRHRQSEKKRTRNTAVKSSVKTVLKKARLAIASDKKEEAKTLVLKAVSTLDKAAAKGVLHRNNASRKVSRLTSALNQTIEGK
ncbi:MAG: 30S ribosomal protein S20 [Deltaproteobacteria bacterium]|nr:30S ribosomal protein S20 [Deltaproteobacteria bacterium]